MLWLPVKRIAAAMKAVSGHGDHERRMRCVAEATRRGSDDTATSSGHAPRP